MVGLVWWLVGSLLFGCYWYGYGWLELRSVEGQCCVWDGLRHPGGQVVAIRLQHMVENPRNHQTSTTGPEMATRKSLGTPSKKDVTSLKNL